MALNSSGITFSGVGSGIDIEGLVTGLMAVEKQPQQQLLTRQSSFKSQLSAYGTLKGYLSSLQTAAKAISTQEKFSAYKASLADTSIATATTGSGAVAGTYSLEVTNLAEAQKIKSTSYLTSSSTVATGTLTLEIGSLAAGVFTADGTKTKNIVIDSSNNTLSGLRDAINATKSGVTASLVNDGTATPYRLVLTSDTTGTASAFKLTGLTGFDYNPATETGSLTNIQAAEDATLKVDGIDVIKTSNVVTDVIQGVTLNLLKTNTNSPTKVSVTSDTAAIAAKIDSFVKAYNDVVGNIRSQTSYNADTKKASVLNGDATARGIQSQLRNLVGGSVGSVEGFSRLADIGIKINTDGSLTTDSAKLTAALSNPAKDVAALFITGTSTTGFAAQIDTQVTNYLNSDGVITSRTDGLNTTIKGLDNKLLEFSTRLTKIEERYRKQFSSLDSLVAGLNNTGSFLTQQLAQISRISI